ncbi:MAG: response regulator [Polyangiaceae bacterium]|nr:response regulator [Polyangiaceae bacterium]
MTTILVADDVSENRYLLVALLEGNGYAVVSAADGDEALRLARSSPPDLIVTDIMMPVMDGFELCRRWRQDERLKRIPFVVYTATYTDPKDERLALNLGADRFLIKPQKPETLMQVVREVLESAVSGRADAQHLAPAQNVALLLEHNDALRRKLEKKVRDLEAEVARRTAAEAELRESERKFRLLAENAMDVVWSMGFDGRVTYLSPAVEKLQGFTPAEALGLSLRELIGPEAQELVDRELARAHTDLAAGRMPSGSGLFEFEQPCKDGSTVWTEVSASVMTDETGNAVGVQGVTRNITARKRAEQETRSALEALARKKHELEGLLDAATAILAGEDFATIARRIFDTARALTGAESGYVALLSPSGEENELVFLESGRRPCTVDQSLPMPLRGLRGEAYRTGEVVCDNAFMSSAWARFLPEGHVELGNVLFAPLNVAGRTVGVMGLANKPADFAADDGRIAAALAQLAALALQRWRDERMLRESEGLLRIAGRMARLGGWSFDVRETRVTWSEEVAAIHEMPKGYSPTAEQAISFYAPEWQGRIREVSTACARHGTPFDEELEILTSTGRRRWVRITGEAIREASGSIRKVQGAFQDISDRKHAESEQEQLQSQLLQAQKLESIGRLAGGVAHDFNNLLSVVLSYAGFALDAVREGDPLRDDLAEIKKAGKRAAALTRQLLAFSRKQLLQPETLSLNSVITGIESMLRRLLGEDVAVEVRLDAPLGSVMADPGQLEQVIMNLAVNARDAMPQGGKLTIETSDVDVDDAYAEQHVGARPGPFVMLSVTDTGTGMEARVREHVFEPFFTTKEAGKGTGLGLSTVYGIVQQSGGSIWLYSEPGRGTTFKILLPRIDAPAPESKRESVRAMARGTETVLVVEDEDAVRRIAERILRGAGYRVLSASGGGDALLLCEKHRGAVDLLLTDVVMPQMSGPDLAARLTKLCPKLAVLYMSGYPDSAADHDAVLSAGRHLVGKPFAAAELTRKVREVLDGGKNRSSGRGAE